MSHIIAWQGVHLWGGGEAMPREVQLRHKGWPCYDVMLYIHVYFYIYYDLYCRHSANKMDSLLVAKGPQNTGSKPGQHPGQAAQNLPQIRAGCPEPWGRQIFAQLAFWQAARIWGRFWAGLPRSGAGSGQGCPRCCPGCCPGFPRSCLVQGGVKIWL